jgi:hypothetical protein
MVASQLLLGNPHVCCGCIPAPDSIPVELREGRRWVGWREAPRRGTKPAKIPINPANGCQASTIDPETWGTFDVATAAAIKYLLSGVGRVIASDDGLAGIDLDGCRDESTGRPDPWAADILGRFSDTYAEVSPSRTGFRLVVAGQPPLGMPCKVGSVECYTRDHYLTFTGQRLDGHPIAVAPAGNRLEWLAGAFLRGKQRADSPIWLPTAPVTHFDDELLHRALANPKTGSRLAALLRGDQLDHGSRSEADYELARMLLFWCGGDPDRVEQLMRASGAARGKWDDHPTYVTRTIEQARSKLTRVYGPCPGPFRVPSPYTPTCADKSVSHPGGDLDRLVEHIRRLRQFHGRPVGLSARQAKAVIGKSVATAARYLKTLVESGRLILVHKGTYTTGLASEYDLPAPAPAPIRLTRSGGPAEPPPYTQTEGGLLALWWFCSPRGQWLHFGDCAGQAAADDLAARHMIQRSGWWSVGQELRRYIRGRGLRIVKTFATARVSGKSSARHPGRMDHETNRSSGDGAGS